VSKALEMSNLNSSAGIFLRWYARAKFRTYMKLSWMQRRFINAPWASEISQYVEGEMDGQGLGHKFSEGMDQTNRCVVLRVFSFVWFWDENYVGPVSLTHRASP
jgi:hypothetical protein